MHLVKILLSDIATARRNLRPPASCSETQVISCLLAVSTELRDVTNR